MELKALSGFYSAMEIFFSLKSISTSTSNTAPPATHEVVTLVSAILLDSNLILSHFDSLGVCLVSIRPRTGQIVRYLELKLRFDDQIGCPNLKCEMRPARQYGYQSDVWYPNNVPFGRFGSLECLIGPYKACKWLKLRFVNERDGAC